MILLATFSIPAIQKSVVNLALDKFRPLIGSRVDLQGIRIKLFNTVELEGIYVEDQQQDTLLYVGKIGVRIHALDLLKNRVTVHKLSLEDFTANVHRASPEDPFNFQFIIDAFAKQDTVKVKKKEGKPWRITANEVMLKNGILRYDILSAPETPGAFNINHIDVADFNFRGNAEFLNIGDMRAEVNHFNFLEKNAGLSLDNLKANMEGTGTLISSDGVTIALNGSHIQVKDALYDLETKKFSLIRVC